MERNKALATKVQLLELRLSDKRGVKTRSQRDAPSGDENAELPAKKARGTKDRQALQPNAANV